MEKYRKKLKMRKMSEKKPKLINNVVRWILMKYKSTLKDNYLKFKRAQLLILRKIISKDIRLINDIFLKVCYFTLTVYFIIY